MRIRASRVAACTTTVALAASALVATAAGSASAAPAAPAAPTAPAALQGDFDGDGYRDAATTAPSATVNGKYGAGLIAVAYGSANGLTAKKSAISQNSAGVAGVAEEGDGFGSSVHTGDFDADGYADLAVGAEGEDVGSDKDGGSVQILWGSASGLSGGTDVPDPAPAQHDKYGQSVAAGDFDGDGTTDLAVGATDARVWIHKGGFTRPGATGGTYSFTAPIWGDGAGAFTLTSGDVNGDQATDLVVNGLSEDDDTNANVLLKGSPTGPTAPAKLPGGLATAIGDFDGDGFGDIAVGNQWDPVEGTPDSVRGGGVTIRYGGADGLDATRPAQHIDQQTPGVPGGSETGDAFGAQLSAGDIDRDGRADLAVGVPMETIGEQWGTGSVIVLKGGATGVTGTGAQTFSQGTAGVPGSNESGDAFGTSVLVSDVDRDGFADITVGGAGENYSGEGALWNLRGSATGATGSGSVNITPTALGVTTKEEAHLGIRLTG